MFSCMKERIHEHQRTGPVDSVLMPLGQMTRYFPAHSLFACAVVRFVRTVIHTATTQVLAAHPGGSP